MALDPEEHARRREERLIRDRENAAKLGKFLLIVAAVAVAVGIVLWAVFAFVVPPKPEPVEPAPMATATVDASGTVFPEGTFGVGEELRVAKGKETINQRKEPKTTAGVVTTLLWPQRVKVQDRVIGSDGKVWYLVVSWDGTNEGPEGWVRGDLLEED